MSKLTLRQQQVYQFIIDYLDRYSYPPTLQEIAGHLGIRGNLGVLRHLGALEKKGYIRRIAGSSRGIVVLGRSSSVSLPIVGSIAAGPLSEALEHADGYLSVDTLLTKRSDSFVLKVRGDSMIEAQIADGDLAIVSPQVTVDNGDIVVAMVDGEATLKRFYREGEQIRLQPENSRLQPIILSAADGEITLLGKVTGIFRSLGF
jgi:repressor LexA